MSLLRRNCYRFVPQTALILRLASWTGMWMVLLLPGSRHGGHQLHCRFKVKVLTCRAVDSVPTISAKT